MMEQDSILDLMVGDHAKIEKLIQDLKNSSPDVLSVKKAFDNFKWEFERHLFAEEKAVFTFYNPKSVRDYGVVPGMLKDHQSLLKMLDEMEKDVTHGKRVDLTGFHELLTKHKSFEEDFFYPKLDKELSEEQKEGMIERINTLIK